MQIREDQKNPGGLCTVLVTALLLIGCLNMPARVAEPASSPEFGVAIEEAWITMPDGVRLAADLHMPQGGKPGQKFPVIFQYDPYRKLEGRGGRNGLHAYFVERGYIFARVDIRGTGSSEGRLIPYEYSDIELNDGEVVIDWLSKQDWSNGNVGMYGVSWSGLNSIQMAMRSPPALKAIIPVHATEDLFQDDVHYMDGIIHVDSWDMAQDLYNSLPAAPDYVIDEAYFENRFDTEPWGITYKTQQRDGPFWDRASARDKYDKIKVPGFFIGGWYDGYRDTLPRMLENLNVPVKAMIGPWAHQWPHLPYPKPGMEWRHEMVRWFDYWLKGIDTGILDEPKFAVYVRDWHEPGPYIDTAPGKWRFEDGWPIERITEQQFFAQPDHSLAASKSDSATHELEFKPSVGLEAGGPVMWWGDVAHDQQPTDDFSLVYDGEVLDEDIEILGFPHAVLNVATSAPRANWFVRLSDVAPDGRVTQVAGAGLNGSHRNSARDPEDLPVDEMIPLDIEMHFTSWVFQKGHRIRFAINNAQWPMLWPTPYAMKTKLQIGGPSGSYLSLPVVPFEERPVPAFLPPAGHPAANGYEALDIGTISGYAEIVSQDKNPETGVVTIVATNEGGSRYPWGTESYQERIEHRTDDEHPENTSVTGTYHIEVTLPERVLLWETELLFSSDRDNFYYKYFKKLSENGELIREKHWNKTFSRDYQ
ncbi:MAG: putative acyl esterase [Lysobacterales bacterium]|jgi:predicted acyl esterase